MSMFLALFRDVESRQSAQLKAKQEGIDLVFAGVGTSLSPPINADMNFILLRGNPMDAVKMMQFGAAGCGPL